MDLFFDKGVNDLEEKNKILLIEDDEIQQVMYYDILIKKNYEVKVVRNAFEALEALLSYNPKLILSDNSLKSEMTGAEFCRKIKNDDNYKLIYFILFSAVHTGIKDIETGIDIGADDYIDKAATDNKVLLAKIRAGVRIHDLQIEIKKLEHDNAILELATTIGHKINNPLGSITMNLHCLQTGLEARDIKDYKEDFQSINEAVDRIKRCVETLTNLQNPEVVHYNNGKWMIKIDC
jgi:DNA-binding response OmpR family regulator